MNRKHCKLLSVIWISCLILIGCSKNLSYEDQISNILVYEEGMGGYADEQFEKVFKLLKDNPETFNLDFERINRFKTVYSDDKKIKAYIIDITDSYYSFGDNTRTILQYNLDGKINTILLPDTIMAIEEINLLSSNKYLFISSSDYCRLSSEITKKANVYEFSMQNAQKLYNVFCIGNEKDDDIEVTFEKGLSLRDDEIYVLLAYRNNNIIDSIDNVDKLAILYNKYLKYLFVADTAEASDGTYAMTGTFKHYHWDGSIFQDVTLIKPLELYNEEYYIRIEQEKNGSCTYMSWKGGKKIGKPDIIIRNGIRILINWKDGYPYNEWISDDDSSPDAERFIFKNNGYEYLYTRGWSLGESLELLEVYDPDYDLIYSGSFNK